MKTSFKYCLGQKQKLQMAIKFLEFQLVEDILPCFS